MRHWIASLLELCNKDHRAWGGFWYIEATVALNFAFFSLDQFSESIAFLRRYAGFVRARTFLQIAEADKDHAAWLDKHHVAFCGACHSCLWWTCRLAALCAGLWGIAVMFTDPSPSVIYFYMLVPVFGYLVAALIGALGFTGLCYYLKWTADTDRRVFQSMTSKAG